MAGVISPRIETVGGFVPQHAMVFGAQDAVATPVTPASPLPTEAMVSAAASVALAGTASAAQVVGLFAPQLGRPIVVALAGSWSGTVQLRRSTDGGATRLPLTPAGVTMGTYTALGVDTPWTEIKAGAAFYLSLPAAGISYRVSQ